MGEWMDEQFADKRSFVMPALGMLWFKKMPMNVVLPNLLLEDPFREEYGVSADQEEVTEIDAVRANFRALGTRWLGDASGTFDEKDAEIARLVVVQVFHGFGRLAAQGSCAQLSLTFGTLYCADCMVFLRFEDLLGKRKRKKATPAVLPTPRPPVSGSPRGTRRRSGSVFTSGDAVKTYWLCEGSCRDHGVLVDRGAASLRQFSFGTSTRKLSLREGMTKPDENAADEESQKAVQSPKLLQLRRDQTLSALEASIQAEKNYPKLLNPHARTRSAVHDPNESQGDVLSDRIASHFSPNASALLLHPSTKQLSWNHNIAKLPDEEERQREVVGAIDVVGCEKPPPSSPRSSPRYREPFEASALARSIRTEDERKTQRVVGKGLEERGHGSLFDQVQRHHDNFGRVADRLIAAPKHRDNDVVEKDQEDRNRIRYMWYIENGLDGDNITPLRREWLDHVASLLPIPSVDTTDSAEVEARVASAQELIIRMTHDVERDYKRSVRKSILDYILRSPFERSRLGISKVPAGQEPHGWGWDSSLKVFEAPEYWRDAFNSAYQSLHRRLTLTNPLVGKLQTLWESFSDQLLVDLPATHEEALRRNWRPQSIEVFVETQVEHAKRVRDRLMQEWHPSAVKIFSDAAQPDAEVLPGLNLQLSELTQDMLQSLFESVATLMGRQLRSLVLSSLERIALFLERFGLTDEYEDDNDKSVGNPAPAAFSNRLDVFSGSEENAKSVQLRSSSAHLETACLKLLDYVATCLNRVIRIERHGVGLNLEFLDDVGEDGAPTADESAASDLTKDNEGILGESVGAKGIYVLFVSSADDFLVDTKRRVGAVLRVSDTTLGPILEQYATYTFVLNAKAEVDQFVESSPTLEDTQAQIDRFDRLRDLVAVETENCVFLGVLVVDCQDLNALLTREAEQYRLQVLKATVRDSIRLNLAVCKTFSNVTNTLAQKPEDSHALIAAEAFLRSFQGQELDDLTQDVQSIEKRLGFLLRNEMHVGADLLRPMGVTFSWVSKVDRILEDANSSLRKERDKLENQFKLDRDEFIQDLGGIENSIDQFRGKGDIRHTRQQLRAVENTRQSIETARAKADLLHEEEERLGLSRTEFLQLTRLDASLEPFERLWSLAERFQKMFNTWNHGVVFTLDAEQVEKDLMDMYRQAHQLSELLADTAAGATECSDLVKSKLDEFKKNLPLLAVIANDGLRDRHWVQVSDVLGFPIEPDDSMTLTRLIELDVAQHLDKLEVISESASKEHSIESALLKMQKEWEPLEFATQEYKDTGTFILQGANVEELQTVLDDHIVKTQTMRGSQYCKFIAKEMEEWDGFLTNTNDLIEAWLKVQSTWLYLDPIFASEDIMKQMPMEGAKFQQVAKSWRDIMEIVSQSPKCTLVAKVDDLLDSFVESNEVLEEINKGLASYLETKRLFFSRFFFLSNDELLEILAETQDPTRVQPFLKKCFEGIKELAFDHSSGTPTITHMVSSEKESVKLTSTVVPSEVSGAVEKWLLQLEEEMCRTVKFVTKQALADFPTKARQQWVLDWPGQIVLAVGSAFWTREVEQVLQSADEPDDVGLEVYERKLSAQLDDLVKLVRGDLSKLERCTLSALAVIDVHARDVVKHLCDTKIQSVQDFDWTSQLRYYWEQDTMNIKIIASSLEYGYEYLGNSSRLVITPLTDRCYRTLMGALHLQYGGAPEGPAGTGKTETVKDLAKALARQCVVFNCSDGLDYLAMAKFFKGLASSGAWACFDEFNRIELEVLSVIAQQISSIQRAIACQLHSFEFEGTTIKLRWTANVFITMNPGYAGRSELPDNLKSLFRTVAMMVPDYSLIAEIILFSYGYADSRNLANKIVTTYKLCSEQLSSQDHYDYGMRAVISVLKAAGALKRQFPDEMEDIIVLRSICDVNLAKFISQDLPLFQGIISDLFPGLVLPEPNYQHLLECTRAGVEQLGVEPVPAFLEKVIQLYEMLVVRHGLMVVGPPLAGKTTSWRVLQIALTELEKRKQMPCKLGEHELATDVYQMNPKAVTMGQLYGCFDPVSHEWSDGVLARTFRDACKADDGRRKWILFDGPVDAVWIENLNTVLDDNKKLCLMSGEIIAMSDHMNMMFEPMDLAVASPATVSRCGMVYMEPDKLGWKPMVDSWLKTLSLHPDNLAQIASVLGSVVDDLLRFVRSGKFELAPTSDLMLVHSFTQLFGAVLEQEVLIYDTDNKQVDLEADMLNEMILFTIVWSIGGTVNSEGRSKFDRFLRMELSNKDCVLSKVSIPKENQVYDYALSFQKSGSSAVSCTWKAWDAALQAKPSFPKDASYSSIIVPTKDTVRYTYLLDLAVQVGKAVLFVGPTGTGKSAYIGKHLLEELDNERFKVLLLGFSAQTTTTQVQSIIDSNLDRRRKGVFGPSFGKRCVVFLDDVNMPKLETYGAQPPLELLRQGMKYSGWYDLKELSFRRIEDVGFVAAMGPPGGGRNVISPRFMRHFHAIGVTSFEDSDLSRIFSSLMNWYLGTNQECAASVLSDGQKAVRATLQVFKQAIMELLPTPSKSHYLFNLRDFSRVVQGMTLATLKPEGNAGETDVILKLWVHEILRVFGDRLVDDTDRDYLVNEMLGPALKSHFGKSFGDVFKHLNPPRGPALQGWDLARRILFGKLVSAQYAEVRDYDALKAHCEEKLDQHNSMSPKPMDLVMFSYAIEHTVRISRIITLPGGNALLVGLGGSGRQSLTRLAAYMRSFEVFQIELSKNYSVADWQTDLKQVLMLAGGKGQDTVFLLNDAQIKYESFVEDINSLLNSGEVPNMLAPDEKAEICEMARPAAKAERRKADSAESLYAFVVERIRAKLHIVLAFSPIGDAFRRRIRLFPSLVNCCVIDWFSEWPNDALTSVAQRFLDNFEESAELKDKCVELCKKFHVSTAEYAQRFTNELRRYYYVTPTSYLELISTFKTMLTKKRAQVASAQQRYQVGLEKLQFTEDAVQGMQKELQDLQPVLMRTTKQTEDMMAAVEKEQTEADKVAQVVKKEEAVANEKAKSAKAIKDECEADLEQAMPILESALAALNTLSKNDITEVKSMKSPPDGVKLVMEAMCVMMHVKPIKAKDPNDPNKKINDYWEPAKKQLLGDPKLLTNLVEYDKDNIDPKVITKANAYVENPDFDPEKIKKASNAAYGLCCWIRAMVQYDKVAKVVAPKRAALAEAEQEFEAVMARLRGKQGELSKIEHRVAGLAQQLGQCKERKKDLEEQVAECTAKLDRAEKLISGLGGEKSRWGEENVKLKRLMDNLIGSVLVCSGVIAYLGPFTVTYRREIMSSWVQEAMDRKIPCSNVEEMNLVRTFGDPVKIRSWNIEGLPIDEYSTENAIILENARRFPLMIDPQGQANKWVRNMEAANDLQVCKLTDANYLRMMENAIQFGKPLLLENIEESLPAALEPLLMKQVFKKGGVSCIKLGDVTVEYSENFRFYITTKLRSPHYLPEVSVKVTLLNFMITPVGLEDQLLGTVVAKERPDLEKEKSELILETSKNKAMLKDIEDKILHVMSASQGNILEDATAIEVLSKSQAVSKDISEKQAVADRTAAKIEAARQSYLPIAKRAATMFFCVADLAYVDPMYQYSLGWFTDLYNSSIDDSRSAAAPGGAKVETDAEAIAIRLEGLQDHFTESLYRNICRSLFEKDKLLFSFLLCVRILQEASSELDDGFQVHPSLFRFLLTGGVRADEVDANPSPEWLPDKAWSEFELLCGLIEPLRPGKGKALRKTLTGSGNGAWRRLYESAQPERDQLGLEDEARPSAFEMLCVLRCLRPDRVVPAISDFVTDIMGARFVEPPPFDLDACWRDSKPWTPLVFVLSPGSDPMSALSKLGEQKGMTLSSLSLGQGQGVLAEKMIRHAAGSGSWIVLQNCHLYPSWMPTLEQVLEEINQGFASQKDGGGGAVPMSGLDQGGGGSTKEGVKSFKADFRLWLTSYPSAQFPVSILQNGVKMTNEPPKGLRANLVRSYHTDPISDGEFFETCMSSRSREFKKLLFGLCFFHAVIQERRSFGPLGWNIPYEFNESDLRISTRQVRMFLENDPHGEIPFKALKYTIGECNYGGRVTDDNDRITLRAILDQYMSTEVVEASQHKLTSDGAYVVPRAGAHASYLDYLRDLPMHATPEVYGMHENADITKAQNETNDLFRSILATQPRNESATPGMTPEEMVEELSGQILGKLADNFDIDGARAKYPVSYNESMNTVLCQELVRFNDLCDVIRGSLQSLIKATQGLVVMSSELETVFNALVDGTIPALWRTKSYPSLKSLAGYVADLYERLRFFQSWVADGAPVVFWISGIFFTQSFNTAILQNFARKYQIPIDKVCFRFRFVSEPDDELTSSPEDGVLINGLFLEGARWNASEQILDECLAKVLYDPAPTIHLEPTSISSGGGAVDEDHEANPSYSCPLYKTHERRGVLSTTGRSTNFVMHIDLPSRAPPAHWIRRGVALLTQLAE
ncbi:Dynein axonemal heavy chain 7 (Axonemal beta dynein heavy chain 7) (Ciliary dynein heavy chain 7) (Dynein heavy chain-like protein 2) (hDHC2) [Durusdinium trenchii]|uniref:Dynein axonemal heavy chain 7 (Axonemal beta dynein heavy chain 7) (Ciliary dynein heavy chain 7) (Dynein heavy chain-like protein 2) (HDHC2) n=1 Tax=Durusdinium trenchii TaxID=1381693 RepID=A0ABP0RWM1_9DINO